MKQQRKKRLRVWLVLVLLLAIGYWIYQDRQPRPIAPERLMEIEPLYQGDYTETITVFAGEDKSVKTSGCGATCIAMAVNYLTGKRVTPDELFRWACDHGYYQGDGLDHLALTDMAAAYGVSGEWIDNDGNAALRALRKGYPVIAHVGAGTFTMGGHYILLCGATDDDLVYVNDPGSRTRTGKTYPMRQILDEIRRESSLMILKP